MGQRSFFDRESWLQSLSQLGDPGLERADRRDPVGALASPARANAREGAQIQREA